MSIDTSLAFQRGEILNYTASADIAYGDVVPLTTRIGIAREEIASGETGSVAVTGVWELPAIGTVAFTVGEALYWDATNSCLTTTSDSNTSAGWCYEAKESASTAALVKIG